MNNQTEPNTNLLTRRVFLINEKSRLESLIRDCIDEGTLNLLRSDYRAVNDELSTFYDDIPVQGGAES